MKPKRMTKVLIALDYGPTAQKVAEVGYSLAKTMGAEVVLLHVISDPVYYSTEEFSPIMGFTGYMNMNPVQLATVDGLKTATLHFLEKSKEHLGDETIQTLAGEGDFAECIVKTAKRMRADVIVMGSHSRKWLEKIVMGSATEKVLSITSIPLFIVPTQQKK
jgi:nucleotide-binding universal stress UspA family protein